MKTENSIRTQTTNLPKITSVVDAARRVVAAKGLSGMSLRNVAEEAGTSVGSISYRIGDRAALITAVLGREIELMDQTHRQWRERMGSLDPVASGILPDIICEWLDEGHGARRVSAIVTCELALLASREPDALPGAASLFEAVEGMWGDLLRASAKGATLARLIARYCLDEQVFSIVLADETDYRLLRHSTIRGLLRADNGDASVTQWHMGLVDRLGVPAAAALEETATVPRGTKAAMADGIADILVEKGVGGLSHRAVAHAMSVAPSSVAHHFPAHRDILFAGVEAVYRRMRSRIHANGAQMGSGDIIRLTHECALAALADPAFRPFAIDMRRRRAENVHAQIAQWLGIAENSDRPRVQAMVMASIGNGLWDMVAKAPWSDTRELIATFR